MRQKPILRGWVSILSVASLLLAEGRRLSEALRRVDHTDPSEGNRQPDRMLPGRAHPHHHPWHLAMVPGQRIVGGGRQDSAG